MPNWQKGRTAVIPDRALPARAIASAGLLPTGVSLTGVQLPAIVAAAIALLLHDSNPMSMNGSFLDKRDGYCLRLADGHGWHIIATQGIRPWAEKLAAILELKRSVPNGHPKFVFIKMDSAKKWLQEPTFRPESSILDDLPQYGWYPHDFTSIKLWFHHCGPSVICEIRPWEIDNLDIITMRQALSPIFERAQESGGVPLHAALVEWKGMGVLLSAPRDTGKSTCCRRLPSPWKPLCDDETLIVRDDQKRVRAHPFPTWSDYLRQRSGGTWNVQHHVPLCAIFFLQRADTDEAAPIGQGHAAVLINESAIHVCRRDWTNLDQEEERALKKRLFVNACELARAVPAFRLKVNLTGQFWKEMERVLQKDV